MARVDGAQAVRLLSFDDALTEGGAAESLGRMLLIEGMAQAAALFADEPTRSGPEMPHACEGHPTAGGVEGVRATGERGGAKRAEPARPGVLAGLRDIRIHGGPRPGDRLTVTVRLVQTFGGVARLAGRIDREDECLAEGEILVSRPSGPALL
jgi:hypothetical protein